MNENVIMNEDVIEEAAENAVKVSEPSTLVKVAKTVGKIGGCALGVYALYRWVAKPIFAKGKAKKAAKQACTEVVEIEDEPIKPIFDEQGNVIED